MNLKEYFDFVQQLPHRGCGTTNELKFAKLLHAKYQELGYESGFQFFKIPKHHWFIYFTDFFFFALAVLFVVLGIYELAVIFIPISIIHFIGWPINLTIVHKFFFGVRSQNVVAEDPDQNKDYDKTLVIVGHYDTGKVVLGAKVFGKLYDLVNGKKKIKDTDKLGIKLPKILQTPGIIAYTIILTTIIAFLLRYFELPGWQIFSFYAMFWSVAHMLFITHVLISPFVPGALDNGSSVVVMLSLAGYFKKNKLKNTRLIFLNPGSEENRGTRKGAGFFVRRLSKERKQNTFFFNLECLGATNLVCTTGESVNTGGIHDSDPEGLEILKDFINQSKEFASKVKLTYLPIASDMCSLDRQGGRVITTLLTMTDGGLSGQYHTMNDTVENINFQTLEKTQRFVKGFVHYFDQRKHIQAECK